MIFLILSIIANWFVIFALVHVFFSNTTTAAVLISAGAVVVLIIVAMTPVAEAITRYLNGGRKPTPDESEHIENVLENMQANIEGLAMSNGSISSVNVVVYVSKTRGKNALSIGRHSIIVTKGLLQYSTDEELAGVFAHEMGHLVHGDSVKRLIQVTVSGAGNVATWLLLIVMTFMTYFSQIFGEGGWLVNWVIGLVALGLKLIYNIIQWMVNLGLLAVGRREEYAADAYAKSLGFGVGLSGFLKKYHAEEIENQKLWAAWTRTHPFTEERIRRLDAN